MASLRLTLACWNYDRTRGLADGSIRPDGLELVYLPLSVEETFFRMMRHREFDCAEMSLSSYVASLGEERPPFVAIPAFPSRAFRHNCIFVSAASGITRPEDLIGKRCGVPEWQLTAPVWTLSRMLADGEIDAMQSPRTPSTLYTQPGKVRRLFENYVEVEREYYRRTRIFPIMHTVVIRRDLYEKRPWIAQSLYKAFLAAQRQTYEGFAQTAASMTMLPWLSAHVEEARREMGEDWWPYGLQPNGHVLETFLRYHHEQGLSKRRFTPEELFAPETLESFKV